MEMKIRWTLPSLVDLHHEADFIAQENPQTELCGFFGKFSIRFKI